MGTRNIVAIAVIALRVIVVIVLAYNIRAMQQEYNKQNLLGVVYRGFCSVIIALTLV